MPLIVIGSLVLGAGLSWFILRRKYQAALKLTLTEATEQLIGQVTTLESSLKESQQRIADLEYTLREREKDLAALKSNRDK